MPSQRDFKARLNLLLENAWAEQKEYAKQHGGVVEDEHGSLIPQPKTDQDKVMFAAGQMQLIAFLLGATS